MAIKKSKTVDITNMSSEDLQRLLSGETSWEDAVQEHPGPILTIEDEPSQVDSE